MGGGCGGEGGGGCGGALGGGVEGSGGCGSGGGEGSGGGGSGGRYATGASNGGRNGAGCLPPQQNANTCVEHAAAASPAQPATPLTASLDTTSGLHASPLTDTPVGGERSSASAFVDEATPKVEMLEALALAAAATDRKLKLAVCSDGTTALGHELTTRQQGPPFVPPPPTSTAPATPAAARSAVPPGGVHAICHCGREETQARENA